MSSKRKSSTRPGMNFQRGVNETLKRENTKGTRPTAEPTSINEVLSQVVLYGCKKTIFFDTNLKVSLYLGALFLISLIGDFSPYPRTYLARSDNVFNVYFVKMGWAWTLVMTTPFLVLTSLIICCGDRHRMFWNHLTRILVATAGWLFWTKLFNIIEAAYGRCNHRGFDSKSTCLKSGHFWNGFDISGHAFILVYSSLVLIEEARPIMGWESIKEYLRNENHNRLTQEGLSTPLKSLSEGELDTLKTLYEKFSPYVKLLFVGMTALQLLWDIMLVGTMLYYHRMIEKVAGGIIAILTWYFTYRFWYTANGFLPDPAGRGMFNYQQNVGRANENITLRRKASVTYNAGGKPVPKFMGMPIYQPTTQAPPQPSSSSAADSATLPNRSTTIMT